MDSKEVAQVDVESAWLSKINWGEVIKVGAAFLAVKGINIPPDVQNDILLSIISLGGVYTFVMKTWFTKTITPASAAGPDVPTKTVVKVLIAAFALSLMFPVSSRAADVPTKAFKPVNPFAHAYDITKCGGFFGAGTMGTAGSLQGTGVTPGTQVVQAGLGGVVGYGCPINAQNGSFWFTDAHVYATNINGSSTGINFSNAPVSFMERFAVGSPLQNMLGSIPGLSSVIGSAAVPSLPLLPTGVTAGPAAPYAFAALHQTDVSAQLGLQQNKQWLLSYGLGAGLLYRLSNGVVADVFAEYKIATNDVCVGPLGNAGCGKFGPGFMTGIDFKY